MKRVERHFLGLDTGGFRAFLKRRFVKRSFSVAGPAAHCAWSRLAIVGSFIFVIAGNSYSATVSWATVGNPGNADNTADGDHVTPGIQNFGGVSSVYRIAKHEVTNAQYAEFLNAADLNGTNPNGIYNTSMGSDDRGGIGFAVGNSAGAKYIVRPNMGNKPVNFVTWSDAARFVNWMNNGQGFGNTETGAYDMTIATPVRLAGASVFLPSEDEWYKAAYYDPSNPAADGGGNADYWLYPYQSDQQPLGGSASALGDITNPGPRTANYFGVADWNGVNGNVTTVGSAGATSFYGAFDMGGNVWEWNEGTPQPDTRGWSGGGWGVNINPLQSSFRAALGLDPTVEGSNLGFRIAMVPEPATCFLITLGIPLLMSIRRRWTP